MVLARQAYWIELKPEYTILISRFCRVIKLDFLHKLCLISVIANSICVTFLSWLAAAWSPEMQFNQFFVFSLCLIFISKLMQLQYATNIWNKSNASFSYMRTEHLSIMGGGKWKYYNHKKNRKHLLAESNTEGQNINTKFAKKEEKNWAKIQGIKNTTWMKQKIRR